MSAPARSRPILFSAPMVRAILADKKTQTRRIVKPQPSPVCGEDAGPAWNAGFVAAKCPFGIPGDRLWVRESFSFLERDPRELCIGNVWYWADGEPQAGDWTRPKPSIFMPRAASRITLEVTGVRVERLQEMQECDAIAEGMTITARENGALSPFREGWNTIHKPGNQWAQNPYVWVIGFRRLTP